MQIAALSHQNAHHEWPSLKPSDEEESWSARLSRFRSSPAFILVAVCVAIFNDVFLFGTIIPVLPYALPHRIDMAGKDVQILISFLLAAYGGALLVGSLVFGWIGDRVRRRHVLFLVGLLMLLLATSFLAFGRTMAILMTGRVLQGLSAALVWTSGLGLLTDTFGPERYSEAVGYTQAAVSIGTTSAPLLGGLVYAQGGYTAVSLMSMVTVVVAVLLAVTMLEPKYQSGWVDHTPATANGHAVANRAGRDRKGSPGFVDERSALIPTDKGGRAKSSPPAYWLLLRSERILTAMWGIFTFGFVLISFEAMIPLFVKQMFHWDSRRAALIFLCWIIPGFLGPIAGKAADRWKSPWIPIGGFLFTVPPLILMRLVTQNTMAEKVLLCFLLSLVGFGIVWIIPYCVGDLSAAATDLKLNHPEEFGDSDGLALAFGLYVFSYSCGFLLGPTVAGVIKAKASWSAATLALALTCVVACLPFAWMLYRRRSR